MGRIREHRAKLRRWVEDEHRAKLRRWVEDAIYDSIREAPPRARPGRVDPWPAAFYARTEFFLAFH